MKGIVLPETAQAKVNEGKVRAVGPGRIGPDGKRIFSSFSFLISYFFFLLPSSFFLLSFLPPSIVTLYVFRCPSPPSHCPHRPYLLLAGSFFLIPNFYFFYSLSSLSFLFF